LSTANLPLLTKFLSTLGLAAKDQFRSHVIFVSLKQFQGKFGGRAQTVDPVPVQFRGEYLFRVEDPVLFVTEVVGGKGAFTTEAVERTLRMFFNQWVMDTLAEFKVTAYDVTSKTIETAEMIKRALYDKFKRVGLELIDVALELTIPEKYLDRAYWVKHMREEGIAGAAEALRAEVLKQVGPAVAQAPGAGIGVGMALLPSLLSPAQPMVQPAATAGVRCPKCGFTNPPGAKFCSNCGSPLQPPQPAGGVACPKCGFMNPPGARFCASCGAPLQAQPQAPAKCPKCGADVPPGARFCPSCGAQIG
ncbi:hypothetical protein DRO32_00500, partial [Candidatus Bathyarchaeota archaeon]